MRTYISPAGFLMPQRFRCGRHQRTATYHHFANLRLETVGQWLMQRVIQSDLCKDYLVCIHFWNFLIYLKRSKFNFLNLHLQAWESLLGHKNFGEKANFNSFLLKSGWGFFWWRISFNIVGLRLHVWVTRKLHFSSVLE